MSQLNGKQIKDTSTSLNKLSGTGVVAFTTGATMSFNNGSTMNFNTGSNLLYADAPSVPTEVANKAYVDSVASGLEVKESVRVISDSPINLSTGGLISVDGITVIDGDRVLVAGQGGDVSTGATANGIYVAAVGAWSRSTDMDEPQEINGGEFVFVREGSYADTGWVAALPNTQMNTIGLDPIQFTQFSSAGVIQAGDGLGQTVNGNVFFVKTGTGLTTSNDQVIIANTGVSATSYGSATAVPTFTVNLQGQLTTAQNVTIDITSGQVNNFTASVNNLVFDGAKFVDSTTIDFQVTNGATVSAVIKPASISEDLLNVTNSPTTGYVLTATASGQFIWVDPTTIGDITEVVAGVGLTGGGSAGSVTLTVQATNGLNVDATSDAVELGGTLTKNTVINGGGNLDLSLDDISVFGVTSSKNVIYSDGETIITAVGTLNLSSVSATYTDTGIGTGIKYAAAGYVTDIRSLTDKEYVDGAIANAGSAATTFAGDGLIKDGLTFSVRPTIAGDGLTYSAGVLDVNVGDGLVINTDTVEIDLATNSGLTFTNGDLTINPTIAGGGLTFSAGVLSIVPVADSLPQYEVFTTVSATSGQLLANISTTPVTSSRIEVYVNGLKVTAGGDVANLLPYNGETVRFTGTQARWFGSTYDIEPSDVIEIVYEK